METGAVLDYERDGYLSPIRIIDEAQAHQHRHEMENGESQLGNLHYKFKIHTVMTSPWELATHPAMLDQVEKIIGPDILLYSASYIIKDPQSESHVSWHQDLTYWGLDSDEQVSAWLALSPANEKSGCMRMIPGSHKEGRRDHVHIEDENNALHNGQNVVGVKEDEAKYCVLNPGEASFHHGWTLHASMPNRSDDRRIGLNVQYLAPSVKQLIVPNDSAILVRGNDPYGNFSADLPPSQNLDPKAIIIRKKLEEKIHKVYDDAKVS